RLVHIPGEFYHGDRSELTRLDKFICRMVVTSAAALRSDLHNLFSFTHCLKGNPRILHRFGKWLFTIRITPCAYCLRTMQGVLKVGRTDDHCIEGLHAIQLVVVNAGFDVVPDLLLYLCMTLFTFELPDVG